MSIGFEDVDDEIPDDDEYTGPIGPVGEGWSEDEPEEYVEGEDDIWAYMSSNVVSRHDTLRP